MTKKNNKSNINSMFDDDLNLKKHTRKSNVDSMFDDNENITLSKNIDSMCNQTEQKPTITEQNKPFPENINSIFDTTELLEANNISNIEGIQNLSNKNLTPNINIPNFRKKMIEHIEVILDSIDCTNDQMEVVTSKSLEILDEFISRAKNKEFAINKDANIGRISSSIIYTVTISNENMPSMSINQLSEITDTHHIYETYSKYFKNLYPKLDFDFQNTHWGISREILSLFLLELLLNEEIDTSRLVLRLREIIINANKVNKSRSDKKEERLLEQLKDKIEIFQYMATTFSDIFIKYFSDLINITKLLLVSNKFHKKIKADFSVKHFVRYLMREKNINLFLEKRSLQRVIGDIFNFLKNTEYYNLFPPQMQSGENNRTNIERVTIIGSRIKLYIMQHLYSGRYFDEEKRITICPECKKEGLTINTSFPRIRSKEFHHKDTKIEGYSIPRLYNLFANNKNLHQNDRGNPYFLQDLIKKMESESVILRCAVHHHLIHSSYFTDFRKLINWENIPKQFPQDIFDLPSEIIHILAMICIDNFYKTGSKNSRQKSKLKQKEIIYNIKKRYIIDHIYAGVCPVCREFNTKEHLPAFDFNHLNELKKMTSCERAKVEEERETKVKELYSLPCSEFVEKLVDQKGGYICRNCHRVIHDDVKFTNEIYEDENVIRIVSNDYKSTIDKYRQNLIYKIESIKEPLRTDIEIRRRFIDYLFALFEISDEKSVITTDDIINKMSLSKSTVNNFFYIRREFLTKYGNVIIGKGPSNPTKYYINDKGKKIIRLMIYFRDYYNNLI